jgi:uncharacterized membrane protein (UPF0127 family)
MERRRACPLNIERKPLLIRGKTFSRAASSAALHFLLCIALAISAVPPADATMRREPVTLVTAAGNHVIDVEVAQTAEEKALGLMFRTSLPEQSGMLFPFDAPQEVSMWMRNTYVSLDMIFIRADGVVHRVESRTEPLSERVITSGGLVTAVLELAGGVAERLGLKAGDRVRHRHFGTATR